MDPRHFPPGGGMPAMTGRDARPLEGVEEKELFGAAFPDDGEGMRLAARGSEPGDAVRILRWEAVLELARRALSVPRRRPERAGPRGDAEAAVRGGHPRDSGGRPRHSRGRGVLQLPGRGRLVMRGALRSVLVILLTAGSSLAAQI